MIQGKSTNILEEAAKDFLKHFIHEYKWLGDLAEKHGLKLCPQELLKFLVEST